MKISKTTITMPKGEHFETLDPLERGDIIAIELESDNALTHLIRITSVIQAVAGDGLLVRLEDSQFEFIEQVDGNIRLVTKEGTMPVSKIIRRENAVPEPQTQLSE